MMYRRVLPTVLLIIASLAACRSEERESSPEERREPSVQANAAAPADSSESVIRRDVLAETDTSPQQEAGPISLTIAFENSDDALPSPATERLDALLRQPVMSMNHCITISGHTDSRGSDRQNLEISRERAQAVADYLTAAGVEGDTIRIYALGEQRPIAPNAAPDGSDYPEGRARNRRVTIEVRPTAQEGADACGAGEGASQAAPGEAEDGPSKQASPPGEQ